TSESGIASISMSYDLKYHLQYIQATNSYRCLQVSVLPRKDTPPDLNGKPIRGLYICESGLRPVTFFDVHMQVSKTCRSTDCYSPKVQSTNFTIRGDRDISAFLYSVRQGIQADHGNSVPRFEDIPGAARYFAGLAMAEPMVNVAPVVMPNENIPSFMGRLFGAHEEEFRTDGDH
ncbi:MAG TPA: hypothetical protein PKC28_15880, partial [Bdellovibrionales bacterium]|nr:hypothetical protein [Bdellovibrionales bacterium]